MGFTTTTNEKGKQVFCCDKCDEHPARVHKCPHNYCQRYYFCSKCWNEIKGVKWGEIHAKCEKSSNEYEARKIQEKELLDSGKFIRCSAIGLDSGGDINGDVQVWFRNKEGMEISFIMTTTAYRSIPLITPATVEDYQRIENANMVKVYSSVDICCKM